MYDRWVKPAMDFIFALLLLLLLLPLLMLIAVLIKLDSKGPVLFKQTRIGKDGKEFQIYKFRTMVMNADKIGPVSTKTNDNRITRFGMFLRKTSLDELPQLLNILKGEMSFIGFRPDVPHNEKNFSESKFSQKPGITGYAQVNGRSRITKEAKLYWENKYSEDISFKTDFQILLKTLYVVFSTKDSN